LRQNQNPNFLAGAITYARFGNPMCTLSGKFLVFRKGTGHILSSQYGAAAALRKMSPDPKKTGNRSRFRQSPRDRLRPLRQKRFRSVRPENRAHRDVFRVLCVNPPARPSRLTFDHLTFIIEQLGADLRLKIKLMKV
jgi:hypothetical protein